MLEKLRKDQLRNLITFLGFILIIFLSYMFYLVPGEPVYKNHSGIRSTIIALELSSSYSEVLDIIGKPGDPILESNVERYIQSIEIDYFFIFLYASFCIGIFEKSFRMSNLDKNIRVVFSILLILVILLDAFENFFLTEVLNSNLLSPRDSLTEIVFYISLLKWVGFFGVIGLIGLVLWLGSNDAFLRIISLFLFIPQLFAIFSIFGRLNFIEIAMEITVPGLLLFWMYNVYWNYRDFRAMKSSRIFSEF